MSELVLTKQRDTIFEIILNRPDKRNAMNMELIEGLDTAVRTANRTPNIRTVIIRGEGKAFSAGIDVSNLLGLAQKYGPHWQQRMRGITDDFQAVHTRLERLEVPTIALLHGYCLGLAMELALACDIRIAAEGTQMGLPET
ncbi:MAG: enoyl-CoA hydratase/isomerase family protein, partial [Anaerolineales bacterium]|nr:enoyl-CoA hydratase/isomerase family protein [Anaerolineales bacterium]